MIFNLIIICISIVIIVIVICRSYKLKESFRMYSNLEPIGSIVLTSESLPDYPQTNTTLDDCIGKCQFNDDCNGVMYRNSNMSCDLKYDTKQMFRTRPQKFSSYIKVRPNLANHPDIVFLGNTKAIASDKKSRFIYDNVVTLNQCKDTCDQHECVAFSNTNDGTCSIFTSVEELESDPNVDTYINTNK